MFKKDGKDFDAITFAGNGEPTLHPDFNEIISDTIALRNKHFSHVKVAVLSNATTCHKPKIAAALQKVDLNILKLDAGTAKTFETINCPAGNFTFQKLIHNLKLFKEKMIIQSLFLKGKKGGEVFDNTTNEEVGSWLGLLHDLQPTRVMIYSIARGTPLDKIEQISLTKLQEIAAKVTELGLKAEVYWAKLGQMFIFALFVITLTKKFVLEIRPLRVLCLKYNGKSFHALDAICTEKSN